MTTYTQLENKFTFGKTAEQEINILRFTKRLITHANIHFGYNSPNGRMSPPKIIKEVAENSFLDNEIREVLKNFLDQNSEIKNGKVQYKELDKFDYKIIEEYFTLTYALGLQKWIKTFIGEDNRKTLSDLLALSGYEHSIIKPQL